MKKIALLSSIVILTTTSAIALVDHYQPIPAGEYHCPERDDLTCIINKYKTGDIFFSPDCVEDKYSSTSKYVPMIKRNQCEVLPDPGKYYACEFADAKCNVNMFSSKSVISCTNSKNINYTADRSYINHKILQAAQTGQCKERYLAVETTTEETTTTTTTQKPVVQKPQPPVKNEPKATEKVVKPEVQPTKPIEQTPALQTQPVIPVLPEIQHQEVPNNILKDMQEQYKEKIRHQLEEEAPEKLQQTITPISPIYPDVQISPSRDNIDINIQMILEKYENLEWEQTE